MRKSQRAFDLLEVLPSDDMTTIRVAWRAKVRALHPDHAQDKTHATARLAEVNAAFDALQGHLPTEPKTKAIMGGKGPGTTSLVVQTRAADVKSDGALVRSGTKRARSIASDPELVALRLRAERGYALARQNVKAA